MESIRSRSLGSSDTANRSLAVSWVAMLVLASGAALAGVSSSPIIDTDSDTVNRVSRSEVVVVAPQPKELRADHYEGSNEPPFGSNIPCSHCTLVMLSVTTGLAPLPIPRFTLDAVGMPEAPVSDRFRPPILPLNKATR